MRPATVNTGTTNGIVTLTFPAVPSGSAGTTYARFRFSTDAAAANPTGAATNGEVEDYVATITNPGGTPADSAKTRKIAHNTNGGPTLANGDHFGGDGVTDLAVGASSDDTRGTNRGAVHVLFLTPPPVSMTTTVSLDGSNNLVIDDTNGGTTNDTITIQSDTTNSRFVISDPSNLLGTSISGATGSGTNTVLVPFASVSGTQILVNTLVGNDSLTVDFSLGNFSKTISYDGGTQTTSDSLTLTGGSTFATVTHSFTSASAGTIAISGNATISYLGLEPITDNLSATDRVFTFNGGAETIALTDAAGAAMTIDSTLGESVTFANPTGSLTINAGTGDDTVTSVDAGFNAALTINGDAGSDTVNLNSDVTFASGRSLSITAESLTTAANADLVTSGTITVDVAAIDTTSTLVSASTVTLAPVYTRSVMATLLGPTRSPCSAAQRGRARCSPFRLPSAPSLADGRHSAFVRSLRASSDRTECPLRESASLRACRESTQAA